VASALVAEPKSEAVGLAFGWTAQASWTGRQPTPRAEERAWVLQPVISFASVASREPWARWQVRGWVPKARVAAFERRAAEMDPKSGTPLAASASAQLQVRPAAAE
jgi:hypothetical protein